jgi:hypothetical protein
MFSDPFRPDSQSDVEIKPTDDDVVRALFEIEKASKAPPPVDSPLTFVGNQPIGPVTTPWFRGMVVLIVFVIVAATFARRWLGFPAGQTGTSPGKSFKVSSAVQAEGERLLQKLASGDSGAADQVLERSANWTGQTHRTPKADQSILIALNRPDLHTREAALAAELALDGVPQSEAGFSMLKEALGDPSQRVWALWMLGALGNRGIDPVHTAKILESFLTDPDVNVRASAVNGLSLLATDETVPPMLDRFRNDPSPVVEERAAC